ncbi:MAG TPA: response regulator [Acidimicrobiia bacterium]
MGNADSSQHGVRVVVAEDEAVIRMDLVEMVRELGHDVVGEAFNGQQAVDLARELKPDVIFLDIAMPERDGLSAAEEIVEAGLCAVIMVTAFSQRDVATRAAEAGAVGYVVKPFTMADLEPAIAVALARWEQVLALKGEVESLGERARAREAVEQAKVLLQRDHGMSEPAAFAWLRRAAMDKRVTLAEVSAEMIQGSIRP